MATIICTIDSDTIDLVDGDESLIKAFKAELASMCAAQGLDLDIIDTHDSRRTSGLNQARLLDDDGMDDDRAGGTDIVSMAWNYVLNH